MGGGGGGLTGRLGGLCIVKGGRGGTGFLVCANVAADNNKQPISK